VALVLHTSGTTSRPKIVPLRHINITASAYHIGETLALTPDDVCLNIMPLFHIHGLIAATLSSLAAGAAVCCTPGFNAFRFFSWFAAVRPTWYTCRPCTRRFSTSPNAMRQRSRRAGCASSAPRPPRCRRK
jgi:acyl-CoA synthetase (AMP-forming)/AMP-acid ligase II